MSVRAPGDIGPSQILTTGVSHIQELYRDSEGMATMALGFEDKL